MHATHGMGRSKQLWHKHSEFRLLTCWASKKYVSAFWIDAAGIKACCILWRHDWASQCVNCLSTRQIRAPFGLFRATMFVEVVKISASDWWSSSWPAGVTAAAMQPTWHPKIITPTVRTHAPLNPKNSCQFIYSQDNNVMQSFHIVKKWRYLRTIVWQWTETYEPFLGACVRDTEHSSVILQKILGTRRSADAETTSVASRCPRWRQ